MNQLARKSLIKPVTKNGNPKNDKIVLFCSYFLLNLIRLCVFFTIKSFLGYIPIPTRFRGRRRKQRNQGKKDEEPYLKNGNCGKKGVKFSQKTVSFAEFHESLNATCGTALNCTTRKGKSRHERNCAYKIFLCVSKINSN